MPRPCPRPAARLPILALGAPLVLSAISIPPAHAQSAAPQAVRPAAATSANPHDWVARSNAETRKLLELEGSFAPEAASSAGLTAFDGKALDLDADHVPRMIAAYNGELEDLRSRIAAEQQPEMKQDLTILSDYVKLQIEGLQAQSALQLDWSNVPEVILTGFNDLLDEQNPRERYAAAAERLARYVGSYPGSTPLVDLAKARFTEGLGNGRIGPYRRDVEQAIAHVPTYVSGVHQLFARAGIKAPTDLARFDRQMAGYARWLKTTVLPVARSDYRLPDQLYALNLRNYGIDMPPQELAARAARAFYVTRAQMQALAPQVAAKFGLATTDYPSVIRALKLKTIPADQVEARYRGVNASIEEIVRRENILTLPATTLRMRLASPAEEAATAAPHMQPPPLVDNAGQQGEFVLTTGASAAKEDAYDDFVFDAATWTLSAHEARPGHELQFAAMVDRGISLARAHYAFNSTNVEGWGLYAESEMLPYEPIEGQLIALQFRLVREARAMLDPMLNLGLIDLEGARRVLRDEVVLSKGMTDQELDRYTFKAPGQAGAYFNGFQQLAEMRVKAELALGERFDRKAFNDFVLDQGLLPLPLLAETVRTQFVPAQLAQPAR